MTKEAPVRAVIYTRISSDPTGRAAGVERQEKDCRALARDLGWKVVEIRRDNDISAYSGKTRPGFRALLADIREGRADAVLAWHSDRLYRRLPDLEDLIKAVQARHVPIRTVRAGTIDLSTASGVMQAEILASVSKHEVAHAVERITAAKEQAAVQGRYRGGPRPFGYEGDGVTVREDEARHLRRATQAIIDGESLRAVCAEWEAAGVRTVPRRKRAADGSPGELESRAWKPTELRRLLLRPRNAGLMEHRGEVIGRAQWAPVVSEDQWRACKAVLENPERRTTTSSARKWLGSGLYRCGEPGCTLTVRCTTSGRGSRRTHQPAYRCWSGKHVTRNAAAVDDFVERVVVERLARPDAVGLLRPSADDPQRGDLAARAAVLRAKLKQYGDDYADDLITRQQMIDGTARTREKLAAVEEQMAELSTGSVLAGVPLGTPDVEAAWKGFHLDRKRAILTALMTVTILPARRGRPKGYVPGRDTGYFDPESVRIDWTPSA
ncbi:recombinase family protein [Streptomyces sp. NPDC006624]|uniref:recombinase family protein n=1 Tax=Streptomyces sp. NPDC006624 TaxID=3154892 RepID=UPI0033B0A7B5